MTTTTQAATFTIDPVHSHVEFAIRHLMLSKVRGRFSTVSGSLALEADGTPAAVNADIEVDSIDTRDAQRDGHLKSPDFFDAATFTHIRFASTGVTKDGDKIHIAGNLEIHGVTQPVVLKAEFLGRATDPWGKKRVGFEATTTINRKDFGMSFNQALETGGVMLGETVEIDLQIEAVAA
jgi:polyisoprenoid-binding protein YceI